MLPNDGRAAEGLLETRTVDDVSDEPAVTVVIPTLNAGPLLEEVLESISGQEAPFPIEILVIDSESTDGTVELVARRGIRCVSIPQLTFNHGATRNDAALLHCETPLVAFLSQDATPIGRHWLRDLAQPMKDPVVAGCFATQRPRPDAHPFQRINAARHHSSPREDDTMSCITAGAFDALKPEDRLRRLAFDNVSSIVRRDVLQKHPFPTCNFGEDMKWARDVLLDGHSIVRSGKSEVLHSHAVDRVEFRDRSRQTHQLWRELTDYSPFPHLGWWIRRTVGQICRLMAAALRDGSRSVPRRVAIAATAPYWGWIQMWANRRGSNDGSYDPPRASA